MEFTSNEILSSDFFKSFILQVSLFVFWISFYHCILLIHDFPFTNAIEKIFKKIENKNNKYRVSFILLFLLTPPIISLITFGSITAPLLKIIPSNQYSSFIWFILTVLVIPLAIYYAFFNVLRTKINENKNLFKAATTLWYLLIAGTFGVFKMFPLNNDWMNIYDAISYIFAGAAFFITFLRYYIDFKSI